MIVSDLERAIELAADARAGLVGTGESFAMIYVDAAIRSLRHAAASLIRHSREMQVPRDRVNGWIRLAFADGMPTPVLLRYEPDGEVWQRGLETDDDVVPAPGAECGWGNPPAVDLGAALLASTEARSLSAGSAGAALLLDALAHHAWFRPDFATRWVAGVQSARSIVTALSGGAAVPSLAPSLAGRHVDREVLRVIENLGWRRDPAARWLVRPDVGQAEGRGCRT